MKKRIYNKHMDLKELQVEDSCVELEFELKSHYLTQEFVVTCERASGVEVLDVYWVDGPSVEAVQEIADKYSFTEHIQNEKGELEVDPNANRIILYHRMYSPETLEAAPKILEGEREVVDYRKLQTISRPEFDAIIDGG